MSCDIIRITKSLCLGLISSLAASHLAAASLPLVWRWANPYPHGANIIDMAQVAGLAVQVGERGQVYTSSDLLAWTARDSRTSNSLRAVTGFNNRIVIAGESGTIVYADTPENFRLVSLGTSDWLEGVAASPNLAVAVGDNAAIYTSSDGATWRRRSAPFSDWLRSVAYGLPGGVGTFVAVGERGIVASSTDGMTWQKRNIATSQDLNRVRWLNGQFWTVGNSGASFTSDSGVTWQAVQSGATNTLNDVAGTTGIRLVAGDAEVRLLEGRGPWSNELDRSKQLPPPEWTYLSAVWTGTNYLLGGRTGMMVESIKTNNITSPTFWFPFSDSLRNWLWDIKRMPNVYLAVGDRATIMSSLDGIDWQQELAPESVANAIFLGIGANSTMAVAVGSAGTIIYSPDERREVVTTNPDGTKTANLVSTLGIIWYAANPAPVNSDLQGITASGNLFVATGAAGTVRTSSDAANWTKRSAPTGLFLSSVEAFPGGFVAVGDDGVILTSANGLDWTMRSSGTANWIYRVRYLGGRLVAIGQNGLILTSADGVNWQSQNSGTTRWLNDVQFIDNTYFAVGTQGTVLSSSDAMNWTSIGTITQKSLYAAAHDGAGQLVTVGIEGIILRSQVTTQSGPVTFLQFPRQATQNRFIFKGQAGQTFSLDRSTDLVNWLTGPQLTITDPSGVLIHHDSGNNAASAQFFRGKPK
ncbi:MAG: hypothetical protein FJ403_00580 [Verrucomicrobia bacterium]|nr:hypothetical protein [Verrucomicrobiota bacterium]